LDYCSGGAVSTPLKPDSHDNLRSTHSDELLRCLNGLNAEAVRSRIATGRSTAGELPSSRTLRQIVRSNLFTRFNALVAILLVAVAFVGPVLDALFGAVLVVNAAIGIIQELRAKRTLDRLAMITSPIAHILRDGTVADYPREEVLEDDVLEVLPGDEVVADGVVLSSVRLQLDESLLTGESAPIEKLSGDEVLSGSIVVSGSGFIRATRIGPDAYALRIERDAKRFERAHSELQSGINRMLQVIGWMILPIAGLLATSQLIRSRLNVADAVRGTVAGIGAMIPEGLVLVTTIAFALGAIRLARKMVLVQSLTSIEGLARVDVVCFDKTGTLTFPGMRIQRAVPINGSVTEALGALAANDQSPNATMQAIGEAYPPVPGWHPVATMPFSSERKWSAVEFAGRGTWVLGAPDVLLEPDARARLESELSSDHATGGTRTLLVGHSESAIDGDTVPHELTAMGLVILSEQIRDDATRTLRYLLDQGIALKVISGDDPRTVASIAEHVGMPLLGEPYDARQLPMDPAALAAVVGRVSVFGRVQPAQKRAIIEALQAMGHTMAMTGDGVNDVLALKQADIGIAMGSGTQASRAVANIVLLDSAFAAVPLIVAEGRRVIANIERVANLFVTKTVYAALIAVVVGISAAPYPFYPRQLSIVDALTIGIPSFFLALTPGAPRAQLRFLRRVLRFAVPAGAGAASATLAIYELSRGSLHSPIASSKMAAVTGLFLIAIAILALIARPLSPQRIAMVLTMTAAGVLAALIPASRRAFAFSGLPPSLLLAVALVVFPVITALLLLLHKLTPSSASGDDGQEVNSA
jgi:cation-transporting ATPase E